MSVLDVGCGKGLFLRDIKNALEQHWEIRVNYGVGVDLVKSTGNVFAEMEPDVRFVEQSIDGNPLAFADGRFDLIFCNHVLEHVFRTEFVVREMRRVLTPNGLCVISTPNLASWVNRFGLLFAGQPIGTEVGTESIAYGFWPQCFQGHLRTFHPAGHIRDFTPRALADLCNACGFQVMGWWNQDERRWLRITSWSGRSMGIVLSAKPETNTYSAR